MECFEGKYKKLEKIGDGTYGVVYKGKNTETGELVAIKKVEFGSAEDGVYTDVVREMNALKMLREHDNIVKLYTQYVDVKNNHVYMVLEYMDTDLKKYMIDTPPSPPLTRSIMKQILKGLEFCHTNCIMHRDLKPTNILVSASGVIKICDFGLSRQASQVNKRYTPDTGTLWYRSPEILFGATNYTFPVDIWSAGCIFVEMLAGWPLFSGDSEIDQIFRICRTCGTPTENTWPGVTTLPGFSPKFPNWNYRQLQIRNITDKNTLDMCRKIVVCNPSCRMSAKELLKHEYFN